MGALSAPNEEHINADGEINGGVGNVAAIKAALFASISQTASVLIYDGVNTSGRLVLKLCASPGTNAYATREWARIDSGHVFVDGFGTNWRGMIYWK